MGIRPYHLVPVICAGIMLVVNSNSITAQRVTPLDVWLACQSPAALDSSEVKPFVRPTETMPVKLSPELHYLCRTLVVPADLQSWQPVREPWQLAVTGERAIPTPAEIRGFARDATADLVAWNAYKARLSQDRQWARLKNASVYFPPGIVEVQPADSITVREMADAIREFQGVYPGRRLTIRGMADPVGPDSVNQRLAAARAINLKIAIVRRGGIDESMIDTDAEITTPTGSEVYAVQGGRTTARLDDIRSAQSAVAADVASVPDPQARAASVGLIAGPATALTQFAPTSAPVASATLPTSAAPNWAVAVTDVVIERAKDDLTVYLVSRTSDVICQEQERRDYFPATCNLLRTGNTYAPTMDMLRVALTTDAGTVLEKAVRISPDSQLVRVVASELVPYGIRLASGRSAADLAPEVLLDIAAGLPAETDVRYALQAIGSFAALYNEARTTIRGVTVESARQEAVASSLRALLVNGRYGAIELSGGLNFEQVTKRLPPLLTALQAWDEAVQGVHEVRTQDNDVRARAVARALGSGIDVVLAAVPTSATAAAGTMSSDLHSVAVPVRDMLAGYVARDYRAAFFHAMRLYTVLGDSTPKKQRFLAFAMDFASAKDEESMRESLRQFVGHGGGYRMKRGGYARASDSGRDFTTLNAYVGISGGHEHRMASNVSGAQQVGAMLAIGLERGWRFGEPESSTLGSSLKPRSFSIFLQVVDLGAIARARVTNGDESIPNPAFTQVFSPGLWGVFSLGQSPLAIGVGAALAPEAISVTDGAFQERTKSAVRFGIFIGGDVPLFP